MQATEFSPLLVRDISVSEIRLGKERCLGDIEGLKRSIREIGLLQPINITTDKRLISGYHRLLAVKELGWKTIPCKFSEYDSLHIELAKLDENLIRNHGTELERATWLAREKEIYEMLHPETRQHVAGGKARQGSATDKLSFARNASRKMERDERTVRRSVEIGRELNPFKEKLLGRPISDNQKELLALAKIEPQKRIALVDILAQGTVNHLWEAKKLARSRDLKRVRVPKEVKLFLGDFRQEGKKIPSHSIDVVFTDPPYGRDYLWVWKSLADLAERVLKPRGFLITYSGQEHLARVVSDLSQRLSYFWTCAVFHSETQPQIIRKKVTNRWKPILIFSKGESSSHSGFVDWLTGEKGVKENHEWAQSVVEAEYFIERFSEPSEMILDPMMGSGSTLKAALNLKRKAMGIEIDSECFKVAESFLS